MQVTGPVSDELAESVSVRGKFADGNDVASKYQGIEGRSLVYKMPTDRLGKLQVSIEYNGAHIPRSPFNVSVDSLFALEGAGGASKLHPSGGVSRHGQDTCQRDSAPRYQH